MKLLYLSVHSILEWDEVSMFHSLGYEIFSPGAYLDPTNVDMRPSIPGLVYDQDILTQWHKICNNFPGEDGKDHLTKEFVDNFDVVIVMHLPRWIEKNWEAMKHKRVIWRTIGQSVASTEALIRKYRNTGLEIVRYSPREAYIPGFCGQDALIRFGQYSDHFGPWNGEKEQVINFTQSMKQRNDACGYKIFEEATRPFPRALFGPGNDSESWMHSKVPYEQLKKEMRDNRCYFYTGTHPASYTLNFMEAFLCFPEETLVNSDTNIQDILVKDYEGEIITLTMENGKEVKCTPNHPFLTPNGFMEAKNLDILNSIFTIRNTNNEQMETRRIGDLEKEFSTFNRKSLQVTSQQNSLCNSNKNEQNGTIQTLLPYFQSSTNFFNDLRNLLLSWNNRWRGKFWIQTEQEKEKNISYITDNQYKSKSYGLVNKEIFINEKQGNFIKKFTETQRSIQFLLEGLSNTSIIRDVRTLSLDQKRALWNFDWFYQESFESKKKEWFLSIRNKLLNQDKNIESTRITKIKRNQFKGRVYNLSTEDGIYWANGCLVHNSGIPIIAIGNRYGNADWCRNHNLYEIPDLIENGITGFISDNIKELQYYIKLLIEDKALADYISHNARKEAIKHFDMEHISFAWKDYLDNGPKR